LTKVGSSGGADKQHCLIDSESPSFKSKVEGESSLYCQSSSLPCIYLGLPIEPDALWHHVITSIYGSKDGLDLTSHSHIRGPWKSVIDSRSYLLNFHLDLEYVFIRKETFPRFYQLETFKFCKIIDRFSMGSGLDHFSWAWREATSLRLRKLPTSSFIRSPSTSLHHL
nr:hypothetical protein [Tanacetum cinerariifolium]